jgi:hypothetical protein
MKYQVFEIQIKFEDDEAIYDLLSVQHLVNYNYFNSVEEATQIIKNTGYSGVTYTVLPIIEVE